MKNTLLITKFFLPERGGIQSYLYNLVLGLEKGKVFIFCHSERSEESPKISKGSFARLQLTQDDILLFDRKQPFKISRVNFRSPLRFFHLTTFDLFLKARRIIKAHEIKKILCGHLPIAGPLGFLIKKTYGIPYYIFTHGLEIFSIKNLNSQKQKMFKRVLEEAEKIIVTTDFMAKYLKKEFQIQADKLTKIPPGVDIDKFKIKNKKLKITIQNLKLENYKFLLTIGRLVKRKNHITVIRALPKIIKEIPQVSYLIAGSGPEEQNLRNEVKKLHLENYVKFLGEVLQEDLPQLYNSVNLFIMPAAEIPEKGDVEGFGLVFLEAAACGLPCIAGNSGGQGEAVENNKTGFLVNPENINEIAATILKILKNPKLAKKLGEAGRARVVEKFNWKQQAEKLKKMLL